MLDFYEKRKLKSILFSKYTSIVIIVAAGFLSLSAYERYTAAEVTAEKRDLRAVELERINEKATILEGTVMRLESERGIEAEIREQFDAAKENEQVVIIVDPKSEKKDTSLPLPPLEEKHSFFEWFKFW